MYSFAQRNDTIVFDEPLYGHYLRVTGYDHPGRNEILESMETDGEKVIREQILGDHEKEVIFFKQMTHHYIELSDEFLKDVINVFLIRDPEELIVSFSKVIPDVTMERIGVKMQYDLYQKLKTFGRKPPVIDSGEILKDPEKVLSQLCGMLGIPFQKEMLKWNAGPIPEDGIWAKYWYNNVHKSTGFSKPDKKDKAFPEEFRTLLDECKIYYSQLKEFSIKAN